ILRREREEVQSFIEFPEILRAIQPVECIDLLRRIMCNPPECVSIFLGTSMEAVVIRYWSPMRVDYSVIEDRAVPQANFLNDFFGINPLAVEKVLTSRLVLECDLIPIDEVALRVSHRPCN